MRVVHRASEASGLAGGVVVPTMGALHEGHASLVRRARQIADERGLPGVVVTVFVNPTQFNEQADFERYPRTLEADAEVCRAAGADLVFAPDVGEVYPPGRDVPVPPLPAVATEPGLEDAHRPGHFAGVCQVVKRLLELTKPSAAVFGEKDWQQLQVVRAMVAQEGMGVEIIGEPTVREADGLAMSSRNRFLRPEERGAARALSRTLHAAGACATVEEAEEAMRRELAAAGVAQGVEYAVVRDAETLLAWRPGRPGRALIAARVGTVRLIDNDAWPAPERA
jgi:pantoate--beta-alanine ligase